MTANSLPQGQPIAIYRNSGDSVLTSDEGAKQFEDCGKLLL